MYVTVFNPGDAPVVISERGEIVGGGDWATVETTDARAAVALEGGALVQVEEQEVTSDMAPTASMAMEQTARYAERAAVIADYDKPTLLKIATRGNLVRKDEDPLRADLERLLVRSDVDLEKPKQRSSAANQK
jgi:hypothetical protein